MEKLYRTMIRGLYETCNCSENSLNEPISTMLSIFDPLRIEEAEKFPFVLMHLSWQLCLNYGRQATHFEQPGVTEAEQGVGLNLNKQAI